ncbi:MAG: DUF6266 family protein [Chloroflexota bacterium]
MGIIKHGIWGPFRGRTGGVIGTFWKGRNVMKEIHGIVYNPNTPAQQEQRLKYKLAKSFNALNKELIRIGFSGFAGSATPDNHALRYNIKNAVCGEFPNLVVDLNRAKLSMGYLENIQASVVDSTVSSSIEIHWIDNTGVGRARPNDQILISIIDVACTEAYKPTAMIKRKDQQCTIELPKTWSGKQAIVLGFAIADNVYAKAVSLNEVSDSAVYGEVIIK